MDMALYCTASSFNTIIDALADLYTIIRLLSSNVSQSQNLYLYPETTVIVGESIMNIVVS